MNDYKMMPKGLSKKWVTLYSKSQDAFHIEYLYEYVESNIKRTFIKENCGDFSLIGIFDDDIEASAYIEKVKEFQTKFINKSK